MLDANEKWGPVQLGNGTWVYARRIDSTWMEGYACAAWRRDGPSLDETRPGGSRGWRVAVRFRDESPPLNSLCGFLTAEAAKRVAGPKVPDDFDAAASIDRVLRDHDIH